MSESESSVVEKLETGTWPVLAAAVAELGLGSAARHSTYVPKVPGVLKLQLPLVYAYQIRH